MNSMNHNQDTSKIRVAVLFGGVSSEHEVSLMSAVSVLNAIPKEKYEVTCIGITRDGRWLEYTGKTEEILSKQWESDPSLRQVVVSQDPSHKGILVLNQGSYTIKQIDIFFPVLHGKNGEDGTVQGLFQLAGLPFVGCDMLSSADCMDKEITHVILEANGIRMAKWLCIRSEEMEQFEQIAEKAEQALGYPMFVKPANAGSSVGVSKARNREQLRQACADALKQDKKALIEEYVDGLEVETAVLGNQNAKAAAQCGEITPLSEFYSYEAKYLDGTTELHIPARIPEDTSRKLRETAERAFSFIGCEGLARVDFFVRREDGEIVLNEINTIPGFTSISMYPKLWEASGLPYPALVDRLIQLGLSRANESPQRK